MGLKNKMHKQMPIIIMIIGLVLFGIGSLPGCSEVQEEKPLCTEAQQLEEILSAVAGAGMVRVFISYEDAGEIIPVYDKEGDAVILRQDKEVIAAVKEKLPRVKGVLIVAEGADDSRVRSHLVAAIRALYGVDLDKISVLKGKEVK